MSPVLRLQSKGVTTWGIHLKFSHILILAAHDGAEDADGGDLYRVDLEEVTGEHDEIGPLARFERAEARFMKPGVGIG